MRKVLLVTGAAGFIGYHTCAKLLAQGATVIGVDNINGYYDIGLKVARLTRLASNPLFTFHKIDISDNAKVREIFRKARPHYVIHLAAQPGVRYSIKNPMAYINSNILGFFNLLECCRNSEVRHFVYASSSSVYGASSAMPYSEHDHACHPLSLYAATKRSNELIAHSYSHIFRIPTTGLRLFTVYGPWGRPDMAIALFTKAVFEGRPIELYNRGLLMRDFTYIDDIVEAIFRIVSRLPTPDANWDTLKADPATSSAPYRVYNIGNSCPVEVLRVVEHLEVVIGRKAKKRMLPMQPGDVVATCAEVRDLQEAVGFRPDTSLEEGLRKYVAWYREYYKPRPIGRHRVGYTCGKKI